MTEKKYILKPETDKSIIGKSYPQVQQMKKGYDYNAVNSVYSISKFKDDLPKFEPNLDYFIVNNKAKLTDVLSVTVIYGGFLISEKMKYLLGGFNLPKHKFYQARVKYKEQFHNYFWMHIICDLTTNVDYKKSDFFICQNYSHNLGKIDISSKEDFTLKKQKIKKDNYDKPVTIWAKKISLHGKNIQELDLFKIGTFDSDYYISERMFHSIIENNISGCKISIANNIFIYP